MNAIYRYVYNYIIIYIYNCIKIYNTRKWLKILDQSLLSFEKHIRIILTHYL